MNCCVIFLILVGWIIVASGAPFECAGGANLYQGDLIATSVCDCCGCSGSQTCIDSVNFLVATAIHQPLNSLMCQTLWPVSYITTDTSPNSDKCPNSTHPYTKSYTCEIGFGCCDGQPKADPSLEKVKSCSTSAVWDQVFCQPCLRPPVEFSS